MVDKIAKDKKREFKNVYISEKLHKRIKTAAAKKGVTIFQFVDKLLEENL